MIEQTQWKESKVTNRGNQYFHYPQNENEFKNEVVKSGGWVAHIHKNGVFVDKIEANSSTLWQTPIFTNIKTTKRNNEDIEQIYENCKIYAVPKGYENMLPQVIKKKIWLYKAGDNASMWEEMYEQGLMGIGWKNLGDLRKYESIDDIESELKVSYPKDGGNKINNRKALWDFVHNVEIGDKIIVAKGIKKIVGYGEVAGDYFFDDTNVDYFGNFRKAKWFKKGEWNLQSTSAPIK